eukprot:3931405-Lingulodinium_polyedra.AAC.1
MDGERSRQMLTRFERVDQMHCVFYEFLLLQQLLEAGQSVLPGSGAGIAQAGDSSIVQAGG